MKAKKEVIKYHTEVINGVLHMECRRCGQLTPCSADASSVLCSECVRELYEIDFPYEAKIGYKPTGRPRGWAFMKEYVDKDGNVFHKGKEQPKLKGKIKPKPAKPKLTKTQKAQLRANLLSELHVLKKKLNKAKLKKDIRKISSQIKKIQKQVK
jgi:hypothetical protein